MIKEASVWRWRVWLKRRAWLVLEDPRIARKGAMWGCAEGTGGRLGAETAPWSRADFR